MENRLNVFVLSQDHGAMFLFWNEIISGGTDATYDGAFKNIVFALAFTLCILSVSHLQFSDH